MHRLPHCCEHKSGGWGCGAVALWRPTKPEDLVDRLMLLINSNQFEELFARRALLAGTARGRRTHDPRRCCCPVEQKASGINAILIDPQAEIIYFIFARRKLNK